MILEEGAGHDSGTERHLNVFLAHAQAFGLSQDDLDNCPTIPECKAFMHWRYYLAYKGDLAGRHSRHRLHRGRVGPAKRHHHRGPGRALRIRARRSRPAVLELHASEIEEGHGDIGPLVVSRYANDEFTQRAVMDAVVTSIDLQWLAFDGMYRAFFEEDPAYDRWR